MNSNDFLNPTWRSSPVSMVIGYSLWLVICTPWILLGLFIPEVTSNVWLMAINVFVPVIGGWYISKSVRKAHYRSQLWSTYLLWTAVASQTVPGYKETQDLAGKKLTNDYVKRFLSDQTFAANERQKVEDAADGCGGWIEAQAWSDVARLRAIAPALIAVVEAAKKYRSTRVDESGQAVAEGELFDCLDAVDVALTDEYGDD